jgi:hypothetical protein
MEISLCKVEKENLNFRFNKSRLSGAFVLWIKIYSHGTSSGARSSVNSAQKNVYFLFISLKIQARCSTVSSAMLLHVWIYIIITRKICFLIMKLKAKKNSWIINFQLHCLFQLFFGPLWRFLLHGCLRMLCHILAKHTSCCSIDDPRARRRLRARR